MSGLLRNPLNKEEQQAVNAVVNAVNTNKEFFTGKKVTDLTNKLSLIATYNGLQQRNNYLKVILDLYELVNKNNTQGADIVAKEFFNLALASMDINDNNAVVATSKLSLINVLKKDLFAQPNTKLKPAVQQGANALTNEQITKIQEIQKNTQNTPNSTILKLPPIASIEESKVGIDDLQGFGLKLQGLEAVFTEQSTKESTIAEPVLSVTVDDLDSRRRAAVVKFAETETIIPTKPSEQEIISSIEIKEQALIAKYQGLKGVNELDAVVQGHANDPKNRPIKQYLATEIDQTQDRVNKLKLEITDKKSEINNEIKKSGIYATIDKIKTELNAAKQRYTRSIDKQLAAITEAIKKFETVDYSKQKQVLYGERLNSLNKTINEAEIVLSKINANTQTQQQIISKQADGLLQGSVTTKSATKVAADAPNKTRHGSRRL